MSTGQEKLFGRMKTKSKRVWLPRKLSAFSTLARNYLIKIPHY